MPSRHAWAIPKLVLLNGPPAVGKSALASRYADAHPLTLDLEIDAIRCSLGGWQRRDESKQIARRLALVMAGTQLRAGHDVVVPQYLGRIEFIDTLERLAVQAGAAFIHILLWDNETAIIGRFGTRRVELSTAGTQHPQQDIDDDASSTAAMSEAFERLRTIGNERPHHHVVSMSDGLDVAYEALEQVIDAAQPSRVAPLQVDVVDATVTDRTLVRRLLQLYRYDFSEFDGSDVDPNGEYVNRYFDEYWSNPDRVAVVLRVDGVPAGFALVFIGEPHDIAEFFVMRKYRRLGVGTAAARSLFARFPGRWTVRQQATNPGATAFWRTAIPVAFSESARGGEIVQTFST